ncbi:MAG: DNA polymerase III subunit beta [Steroidobacteraceae bacterium]|jgi:DNA polymerase-3 subunit beta|nr:DNA polymerase III subunit beta [Steroidobacteraceae bacterium]
MKLTAPREEILAPLQSVIGVVERRQTMPVLSNVLVSARNNRLSLTGTDLEVELVSTRELQVQQAGDVTVPGRKFLDILKALPEAVEVTISTDGDRLVIKAGRSRFTLATLPAAEFPLVDEINAQQTLKLPHGEFRRLIDKTHFSMAQQDVRYYLNGMLLEAEGKQLRAVATDGHRLAMAETSLEIASRSKQQVIVPRKGVLELQRILGEEGDIELAIGTNHVRAQIGGIRFTSKLIDGRFPEYGRVIPANASRLIDADRDTLRHSLQRTAILSNEKYRGIRLNIKPGMLTLQAHNPEQEEAEDQLEVGYTGEEIEIGFNVNYLLDALAAIDTDRVTIALTDANSSCLITAPGSSAAKYVVMPMRL